MAMVLGDVGGTGREGKVKRFDRSTQSIKAHHMHAWNCELKIKWGQEPNNSCRGAGKGPEQVKASAPKPRT